MNCRANLFKPIGLTLKKRGIAMETELLKVTSMTCGGCANNIAAALKAIPGVDEVTIALSAKEVTVQYDRRLATSEQVQSAVKNAGYAVDSSTIA